PPPPPRQAPERLACKAPIPRLPPRARSRFPLESRGPSEGRVGLVEASEARQGLPAGLMGPRVLRVLGGGPAPGQERTFHVAQGLASEAHGAKALGVRE